MEFFMEMVRPVSRRERRANAAVAPSLHCLAPIHFAGSTVLDRGDGLARFGPEI